ncbi:zinc finger protein 846-like isoform X2 [Achroia grisella]|uniref:zinc finger protein 846-like isoform X2 n=1 Tax=Achroia grisella TaxID=688607 RepID=UPI0027D24C4C|nr:zinc finger protein 846-like isoform X2 [Achroia grisella]
MDPEILVETLPLFGICNLCLTEGPVKSMLLTEHREENTESYIDMLTKCFSIDITILQLGDSKRLICDPCISKLCDCLLFRQQVETSLKSLESAYILHNDDQDAFSEVKKETHGDLHDDFDFTDFGDEEDHMTLNEFKIKEEPQNEPRKTRSTKSKPKLMKIYNKIKKNDLKDTEAMLDVGLFPFKIRKNFTFTCSICPESSKNLDDIKNHITEHNKNNIHLAFRKMMFSNSQRTRFYKCSTKLRCKLCTTDVASYDELRHHIDNCSQLKYGRKWNKLPFKLEKDQLDCPVCKKTFLNYVSLNTHMNIHYPNYICENCGKAFASKARLRGHMRTHEVGNFPCRHCDAVFDRVTKRENHVSKEHKSGVRYACKRCNISLTSFYARQKHLAEVHNEELKRYKCKVCSQCYITPGHLSSHVRRDHLNERNHKCDKCDLAFYTKNALKMHMIKHDGERIHTCHICQKSYQRKKTLTEHLRIHNNDKRFVCPVCGRAFTQKCTLKGHLKVHERKLDLDERIVQPLHSA